MEMRSKSGFTLVELMIVAVIVAILAAVSIPLMSANKKRAMATEAEAALGTIRAALRSMYVQSGAYNLDLNGDAIADGSSVTNVPGIGPGDLDGRYFTEDDYTLTDLEAASYTLTAVGTGEVAGVTITLDEAGKFVRTGL
jgi:prepilin-type N-terminal cleavage/methylation domain-containing protein